ncbi:MAG: hypothetical protein MJY75_00005, partial [Bacteroidaceae bacterium]|nr:hypothetical protein [Bacteroidaceae bacterium]
NINNNLNNNPSNFLGSPQPLTELFLMAVGLLTAAGHSNIRRIELCLFTVQVNQAIVGFVVYQDRQP